MEALQATKVLAHYENTVEKQHYKRELYKADSARRSCAEQAEGCIPRHGGNI